MAGIKINPAGVMGSSSMAESAVRVVGTVSTGISTVKWGMDSRILSRYEIGTRLGNIQSTLLKLKGDIQKLHSTVNNGAVLYAGTENRIVVMGREIINDVTVKKRGGNALLFGFGVAVSGFGEGTGLFPGGGGNFGGGGSCFGDEPAEEAGAAGKPFDWKVSNLVWRTAGKFGVMGKAISTVGKGISNKWDYKAVTSGAKNILSGAGEIASEIYKETPNYKESFWGKWKKGSAFKGLGVESKIGIEKGIGIGADTVKQSLGKQLRDYSFKNAENVGEKIKVGTKWAGLFMTGVSKGIENYRDYKDGKMTAGRAVAETITEKVVETGINMGATALATGAAAALGLSAPAVVVGGAAVAVVWGADLGCRALTRWLWGEEKGLTESVSDVILDGAKFVCDKAADIGRGVGNLAKKAGSTFAKWGKALGF